MKINIQKFYAVIIVFLMSFFSGQGFADEFRSEAEIRVNPRNIMDYFLIIPPDHFIAYTHFYPSSETDSSTEFGFRKEMLISTERRKVNIDKKNNFLQIIDDTSQLSEEYSVKIFNKKSSGKVLAVTSNLAGGDYDDYVITIYEYEKLTWHEITAKILPKITFTDFWGNQTPLPEKKYQKIFLHYFLQPIENIIKVESCCIDDLQFNALCDGQSSEGDYSKYLKTYEKYQYRVLYLNWDSKAGVFKKGFKEKILSK